MNVHTAQTLNWRLRSKRVACGMTQAQLAEQSRVPIDELAAIEQGAIDTPYFTSVALLARALGVDAHWLYYGTDASSTEP
jgi:transcriptional regulator with XRE-family HTH domain